MTVLKLKPCIAFGKNKKAKTATPSIIPSSTEEKNAYKQLLDLNEKQKYLKLNKNSSKFFEESSLKKLNQLIKTNFIYKNKNDNGYFITTNKSKLELKNHNLYIKKILSLNIDETNNMVSCLYEQDQYIGTIQNIDKLYLLSFKEASKDLTLESKSIEKFKNLKVNDVVDFCLKKQKHSTKIILNIEKVKIKVKTSTTTILMCNVYDIQEKEHECLTKIVGFEI